MQEQVYSAKFKRCSFPHPLLKKKNQELLAAKLQKQMAPNPQKRHAHREKSKKKCLHCTLTGFFLKETLTRFHG